MRGGNMLLFMFFIFIDMFLQDVVSIICDMKYLTQGKCIDIKNNSKILQFSLVEIFYLSSEKFFFKKYKTIRYHSLI